MTKDQFLKTYGQPNTVVSFKNDAEKMEFLKECEAFAVELSKKTKDNIMSGQWCVNINSGLWVSYSGFGWYESEGKNIIMYDTPSPKSLIKDGWMGVRSGNEKVYFLPSVSKYCDYYCSYPILNYDDELIFMIKGSSMDIMELYDNLGNLQWKREEKSQKDIEIERIQAEMNKLAQDLSKLKGE